MTKGKLGIQKQNNSIRRQVLKLAILGQFSVIHMSFGYTFLLSEYKFHSTVYLFFFQRKLLAACVSDITYFLLLKFSYRRWREDSSFTSPAPSPFCLTSLIKTFGLIVIIINTQVPGTKFSFACIKFIYISDVSQYQ